MTLTGGSAKLLGSTPGSAVDALGPLAAVAADGSLTVAGGRTIAAAGSRQRPGS